MKYIGLALLALVGILVLLLLVAVIRTLMLPKKKTEYSLSSDEARTLELAKKLSKMVQYETVSSRDNPNVEKFRGFHKVLEELFPTVFAKCEQIDIDGCLLL